MDGTLTWGYWDPKECKHRWKEVTFNGTLVVKYLRCEVCGECYPLT